MSTRPVPHDLYYHLENGVPVMEPVEVDDERE